MLAERTAGAQFLGYLYQMEYALYLLIKAEGDTASIAIEYLDDVSFNGDGSSIELFQMKHVIRNKSQLTNISPELWKTIGIWSEGFKNGEITEKSVLTLVTNAIASTASIAYNLRPLVGRDNKKLSEELLNVANNSQNVNLKPSFDSYRNLTPIDREKLIGCIRLLDGEVSIDKIADKIKENLQVRFHYRDSIYERLHGWWFNIVVKHVIEKSTKSITRAELLNKITDINDQFRPDALPIDFYDVSPEEPIDAVNDKRLFVQQLREIALKNREIEHAILDYYRAFQQRSRWEREQILNINELERYEQRLTSAWERVRLRVERNNDQLNIGDDAQVTLGRKIYDELQDIDIRLRPAVDADYVCRGSYHMLADEDQPRVYWNPQFLERLYELIEAPEKLLPSKPVEVTNLFNPAFVARVIRASIKGYYNQSKKGMPFPLLFLITPLVFNREYRDTLPKRTSTKMHAWLQENQQIKIDFAIKSRSLVKITKEGLMLGMQHQIVEVNHKAEIYSTNKQFRKQVSKNLDTDEIKLIEKQAEFLGKWFARTGNVSMIYRMWGVRP